MMAENFDFKAFDFDPHAFLDGLSSVADEDIDLAKTALALAAHEHEGISLQRYVHHLAALSLEVGEVFTRLREEGHEDGVSLRHRALISVLSDEYGYSGDSATYDDLQNASLIKAIDRAKGLPITLCILYIHAARAQGWGIDGLNFPGHFLCRLEKGGERLIFDPFTDGEVLDAPDLRALLKKSVGAHAELSSDYYEAASNRDILIRLENNIKHRMIEGEDYKGALRHVDMMRKVAPEDYRLLLDAGVLYAKTDQAMAAIESLNGYLEKAPYGRARQEAEFLLRELSQSLN